MARQPRSAARVSAVMMPFPRILQTQDCPMHSSAVSVSDYGLLMVFCRMQHTTSASRRICPCHIFRSRRSRRTTRCRIFSRALHCRVLQALVRSCCLGKSFLGVSRVSHLPVCFQSFFVLYSVLPIARNFFFCTPPPKRSFLGQSEKSTQVSQPT